MPAKTRRPAPPDKDETAESPDAGRPLTLSATADMDLEATGEAAPRFRMIAYSGGAMRLAGWRFPVVVDLAGLSIPSQSRPIRFGHDPASGVGHTDSIRVEGGKLVASGVVSRDTAAAREVVASSRNGFPWQASIGAGIEQLEFVRENARVTVNGREHAGPLNVVRKATLGEISFVDVGADAQSSARIAASAEPPRTPPPAEDTPAAEAPDGEGAHEMAEQNTKDGGTETPGNAPPQPPATPTPTPNGAPTGTVQADRPGGTVINADPAIRDLRAQAAAETERIAAVRKVCGGRFPTIEAQAIREGWDEPRCELEVLRAARPAPPAPAIHVPDNTVNGHVLEAACMLTAGLQDLEASYDARALDLASKRFRGGIGLQELLLEAAWANGYTGRNFRDSRSVLRTAFGVGLEAAFSTIDVSGILSNVANKFLLEGFYSVERTWRNITAVRNVSDFKTVTSYRLVGKDQYELVAPGGEIKHGTLGEEKYTNRADTYGLLLAIDRRDLINDDLGAITSVPRKLGRGSGLKINDVFWTIFLDSADFFKAENNNFLEGADTVLTIDGLTKAEVAFMDQVDADGKPIGVLPAVLLVPTALSAAGSQLFKSMELRDTTSNTKYPVSNPHQGKFRVEVSRYLANARYTGSSAKAWYLLAESADLPVIETAFLNGQESPTIETAEADFNVLGIQMRGYHDFGVALQDPRGGVKAKGEA